MKKIIYIIFALLVLTSALCEAHISLGYKPERTTDGIQKVASYFKDNYNLTLNTPVVVYVTKNTGEYKRILEKFNVPNAKHLAYSTHAVTSSNNGILINNSGLSDKHFLFILAHELIHRYQFENYKDPHSDYVLLEGLADNIASKISKYYIEIEDHRIPYDELKSREQFFKSTKNHPNETLEQIRYYTKDIPFLK